MAVIERADAPQTAQHVGEVAAENATIGVQLVDHDIAKVGEQLHPAGVMGQHAGVQHVGVGDDDVAGLADRLAGADRRVTVVRVGLEIDLHLTDEAVKLGQLILRQRLGRKQVERSGLRVLEHRL